MWRRKVGSFSLKQTSPRLVDRDEGSAHLCVWVWDKRGVSLDLFFLLCFLANNINNITTS